MIDCQRDLFDIPEDICYLNCAYMSPLMHEVVAAGTAGLRRKARPWEVVPADFFTESEAARAAFAGLINADADDIAIVPAASYGIAIAAANLPVAGGQNIVVLADQFPSNVYSWRALAAERSAELRTVARPADGDWTAAILAAVDDATALAALPHCHWTDGGLIDLEAVGAAVRAVGAALVIDATQSLGALPLDCRAIKPDYLVAATYKWLLGPYAFGFLYVAPAHHGGQPLEHNWIHRAASQNFSALVTYRDDFQPGARRFDVGERSNFALVPAAHRALVQIAEWTVPAIQETLTRTTDIIAAGAEQRGFRVLPKARRAGHFLGLGYPGSLPDDLAGELGRQRVFVSVRGESIRVTPHVYNHEGDIEAFFAALDALIR